MDVVVVQQVWGQCTDPCPGAQRSGNESPHGLAEIPQQEALDFHLPEVKSVVSGTWQDFKLKFASIQAFYPFGCCA